MYGAGHSQGKFSLALTVRVPGRTEADRYWLYGGLVL